MVIVAGRSVANMGEIKVSIIKTFVANKHLFLIDMKLAFQFQYTSFPSYICIVSFIVDNAMFLPDCGGFANIGL